MKKSNFRSILAVLAFVAVMASFASCNRGYGCPTNFSAGDIAAQVVENVAKAILPVK